VLIIEMLCKPISMRLAEHCFMHGRKSQLN
jgi:hypothetical protein